MSKIFSNFAAQNRKEVNMTALELNAELYKNLGIIAEDETMYAKVVKYVRNLAKKMQEDPTRMTEEEFFARVDEAREEIRQGKGISFTDKAEMNAWLNSL